MCYIMGVFSPSRVIDFRELVTTASQQLLLRGRDTVGCFFHTANDQKQSICMLLSRGAEGQQQLDNFLFKLPAAGYCMMLQTGAVPEPEVATQKGSISLRDIQPFEREKWVISHNGTVVNDRELRTELSDVDWQSESSVDSAVLPYLFVCEGIYPTIGTRVEGSFALAAYNSVCKVFHLAKNFQPLYYNFRDNVLYYSSLPTRLTPMEFPPYKLLTVDAAAQGVWRGLYREEPKKSILVTHSSGLDSTITLRLYQVLGYEVGALFFKYGQYAESVEEHCSKRICEILDIPWYSISLPMEQFTSPLLSKEKQDLDPLEDAESTFSYVPQRNLIMTAYALAMAEQLGFGGIALGMNLSDAGGYPDNGVPFLNKLGEITPYSSNCQTRLKVASPFVNLLKSEMLEVGLKIGIPFDYVCACYYPELSEDGYPVYCNNCGSDVHYSNAWGKLGYQPPSLGFVESDKLKPILFEADPEFRIRLKDLPFRKVIEETL